MILDPRMLFDRRLEIVDLSDDERALVVDQPLDLRTDTRVCRHEGSRTDTRGAERVHDTRTQTFGSRMTEEERVRARRRRALVL